MSNPVNICIFVWFCVYLCGFVCICRPGYASQCEYARIRVPNWGVKMGARIRVPSWRPKLTSRYASRMSYLLRYVPGGRVGGVGWCVDTRPSVYMCGYASQCQYVGIRVPVSICGDTRPSVNMCQFCVKLCEYVCICVNIVSICVNIVSICVNMCVFV